MRTCAIIIVALAFAGTAAAAPRHGYSSTTPLGKMEQALRRVSNVYWGISLEPGRCALKGRTGATYARVECSWRGGWRNIIYMNPATGKQWFRICPPSGNCNILRP